MAWFHSIKLALIRRFLGARHHSAWCSGNGQPRRASSKSGCVWETAEQSRRMHAAGRVTVQGRSLPPSKEIESPMFPPHLPKPPSSAGTAGHRILPVSGTWCTGHVPHVSRATGRPAALTSRQGPGWGTWSSVEQGSICSGPAAATLITWAGEKCSLWGGSEMCGLLLPWQTQLLYTCLCKDTHTHSHATVWSDAKIREGFREGPTVDLKFEGFAQYSLCSSKSNVTFCHLSSHTPHLRDPAPVSAPTILPTGSTPSRSPSSSRVLELHWPRPLGHTRAPKVRPPLWFTLGKQRVSFCSASGKNMSAELTGLCFLINKSKVSSVHHNLSVSSCLLTRGACSVNSFSLNSLRPYGL